MNCTVAKESEGGSQKRIEVATTLLLPCWQALKADASFIPKTFVPDPACEMSVHDVLAPQPFQDSITTAPPTTQAVRAQNRHKEEQVQGKGVNTRECS